jgi:predicted RNA-binding protein with PUA-like domain
MAKQYWLVKSEPESYSWSDLVKDGKTSWTGVRNFQARNNLRAMKKGDLVAFYHSVTDKQIVGIAKVIGEAYPDKTADEGDWSTVDLAPEKPLKRPISLAEVKADAVLKKMALVRLSRISVVPVDEREWLRIAQLASDK